KNLSSPKTAHQDAPAKPLQPCRPSEKPISPHSVSYLWWWAGSQAGVIPDVAAPTVSTVCVAVDQIVGVVTTPMVIGDDNVCVEGHAHVHRDATADHEVVIDVPVANRGAAFVAELDAGVGVAGRARRRC